MWLVYGVASCVEHSIAIISFTSIDQMDQMSFSDKMCVKFHFTNLFISYISISQPFSSISFFYLIFLFLAFTLEAWITVVKDKP